MNDVGRIELRLYQTLISGQPQMKVAKLIAVVFRGEEIPDDTVTNAALDRLVVREDIEVSGNHKEWRHSEIKRNVLDTPR